PEPPKAGETPAPTPAQPAPAQPAAPPPPAETPITEEGQPKEGQIVGGRVNIRAGPGTAYEIIATVDDKTPIKVYAVAGEWVKIGYPTGEACYVHQDYIEGNIPPDIPESGRECTIKGDKVMVRAKMWDKSTVVGELKQGDTVVVTGLRGPWARILPPACARAWVFHKYVKYEGAVAQTSAPPLSESAASETAKKTAASSLAAKRREELAAIAERAQRARELADEQRLQKIVEEADKEVAQIEAEIRAEQEAITVEKVREEVRKRQGPGNISGFSGWIEYIGWVGKRPAAYRLVQGEETVFLLRSAKYDLSKYVNRRVLVDGVVETAPGFEANVLVVDRLQVVSEPPPALKEEAEEEAARARSAEERKERVAPRPAPAPAAPALGPETFREE
ncbi:MAG: SH3 domain-containing protein, partial [Planctomycetota bacterium]|nr:SH3 domain-containing protein [Planctomycetota bacterium]